MPKSSKLVKTRSFRKISVPEDPDESDGNFAQKTMSNPASKPRLDEQVTSRSTYTYAPPPFSSFCSQKDVPWATWPRKFERYRYTTMLYNRLKKSNGVVVPGLYRSRSLPHYLGCDSGVGSFSEGGGGGGGGVEGGGVGGGGCPSDKADGLVGELRQLITLRQHYYPEGGWGWVVLAASVLVHLLSHGLQLAAVLLPPFVQSKFGPSHPTLTGE
ncbi:hypothetical protein GE061_012172 [Apolygus lucorum]|uniref:Uncharacterized protein n=1 Tax=Apolygus lucorum TaxID=248454 RepID=A0A8S9XSW4_APOLU|nr:hypothetical protein GE061_012172 [Apolygus lucorum]